MIIKGLFRRYERWNPVHPTVGAFWGMGVGVGCGVGWGPGFGPEVIGYVGSGCGVGFNVGFTFAGMGIGLPANALIRITSSAFAITSSAVGSARSTALPIMKNVAGDSWSTIYPHVTSIQREICDGFTSMTSTVNMNKHIEMEDFKKFVQEQAQSAVSHMEAFRSKHLPPAKGRRD